MAQDAKFRSISLYSIGPDEPLPFRLAIFYKGRHLVYRMAGQPFESQFYNKFIFRRIHRIYVPEEDYEKYLAYQKKKEEEEALLLSDPKSEQSQKVIAKLLHQVKSVTNELFASPGERELQENVLEAVKVSGQTVEMVLNKPYAQIYNSLSYKANTVADHSMRVSILGTFLAMRLGYVNPAALEQIAAAGLLHDIGKTRLKLDENFIDEETGEELDQEVMKQHPVVSCHMLEKMSFVPQEVFRIIREHHEARDGSGYPAGIRGVKMYGLSRVFIIANVFDNLTSSLPGTRKQKYLGATKWMLGEGKGQFDTALLSKAVKALAQYAEEADE